MCVLSNWVVFWVCRGRMAGRVVIDDCRFTIYYLGLWWGGKRIWRYLIVDEEVLGFYDGRWYGNGCDSGLS